MCLYYNDVEEILRIRQGRKHFLCATCPTTARRWYWRDPAGSRDSPSRFLPSCSHGACGVNVCHPGVPTLHQSLHPSPGPWIPARLHQSLAPCDLYVPLWVVAPGSLVRSQSQFVLSWPFFRVLIHPFFVVHSLWVDHSLR